MIEALDQRLFDVCFGGGICHCKATDLSPQIASTMAVIEYYEQNFRTKDECVNWCLRRGGGEFRYFPNQSLFYLFGHGGTGWRVIENSTRTRLPQPIEGIPLSSSS